LEKSIQMSSRGCDILILIKKKNQNNNILIIYYYIIKIDYEVDVFFSISVKILFVVINIKWTWFFPKKILYILKLSCSILYFEYYKQTIKKLCIITIKLLLLVIINDIIVMIPLKKKLCDEISL